MIQALFGTTLAVNALLAGLAAVLMCSVLSVLVVVKRLGFVGQGVSHSAFGGIGVATVLAVYLPASLSPARVEAIQFAVIVAFCIAAALGMSALSSRREVREDTAIGLFLVGSMALGAILIHVGGALAERSGGGRPGMVQSWESLLFGSIMLADDGEVRTAWAVASAVLLCTWWVRRPLLFYVFDEESAPAFGVRTRAMQTVLMVLLAVSIVVAMKLTGVVLATALLVLPGATALRLSRRLRPTLLLSVATGVLGLVGGLLLSIKADWPTGPSVVAVLTALFAAATLASRTVQRRAKT